MNLGDFSFKPGSGMADNTHAKCHPIDNASFISRVTLWWTCGILRTGYERPLEQSDLYAVRDAERASRMREHLKEKWEDEIKRAKLAHRKPLLWKALLRFISWKEYALIFVIGIFRIFGENLRSFCIIKLISVLGSNIETEALRWEGTVFSIGIIFGLLIRVISLNHFHLCSSLQAIRIRAGILGLIYDKVLSLPQAMVNSGHVMELVSEDSQRLVTNAEYFLQNGVAQILESVSMFAWLVYFVGWQAVAGYVLFVTIGILRLAVSKVDYKLRKDASLFADQRLGYLREILTAIRAIKLTCGWEKLYEEKVTSVRRKEIFKKARSASIIVVFSFMNFFGQGLATFLSILLLLYTKDGELTSQSIFSLMVYMTVIDICWSWAVPLTLSLATNVTNSLYRIQAFLEISGHSTVDNCNEAIPETPSSNQPQSKTDITETHSEENIPLVKSTGNPSCNDQSRDSLCFVSLHEVTCKPPATDIDENDQSSSLLYSITLSAADLRGLVVVVGAVGSGKSSLLSCILGGELCVSAGAVAHSGKFAYVAQTPWVFPGTVRENIVFGSPYNEFWYAKTAEVCQLAADFKMFPEGDLSLIGEHGSTVSGGQRTRIALARAIYSQADIYLLDDPFSALDARVAASIFNECLRGLLAGRIIFLTTHNVRLLSEADYIVSLNLGTVVANGNYPATKDKFGEIMVEDDNEDTTKGSKASKTKRDEITRKMDQSESLGQELRQDGEDRETGNVKLKVYWEYFKHGLPGLLLIVIAVVFCIGQALVVMADISAVQLSHFSPEKPNFRHIMIRYTVVLSLACLVLVIATAAFYFLLLNTSLVVHNKMVKRILKAPLVFHALNPVGRIMNRFSQDINSLDDLLPVYSFYFLLACLRTLASLVFIISFNHYLVILLVLLLFVIFYFLTRIYCQCAMDIKRLMSISCCPLYSHFSNTMNGIKTIRAYQRKKQFMEKLYSFIDAHNQSLYVYYPVVRWFAITLDIICAIFMAIVILSVVFMTTSSSNAAFLGLTILYASVIADFAQYSVRMFAETHSIMTSAERTLAYTKIDPEKGQNDNSRPPAGWPNRGEICFRDVSLSHYDGGPKALRNLTFDVNASEKIGIAGRTGAGKSSLVAALMRLSETDGDITVDGVLNKDINVQVLRESISVISQSPVLVSGRLRESLDARSEFLDSEIWDALERVQMKYLVSCLPDQLDTIIEGSGSNFSVGERQLVHLARVLLQKRRIIIFDEATANVDWNTDEVIQRVVRDEFEGSTVITIAHRLNTIVDCDRIMLLDNGEILEFDEPKVLLRKKDGGFRKFYETSRGSANCD